MHPLQTTIRRLARRERRLLLLRGTALCVAVVLLTALLTAVVDYLVRYHEPGLRWLASAALGAIALLAVRHWLVPVWSFRRSDVSTAQCVEQCYPELGDRLSSAIAFLNTSTDEGAGSPALRRALVDQVDEQLRAYPLDRCLSARQPRRAVMVAGIVCTIAAVLTIIHPSAARLTTARLMLPWSDSNWPRRNHLVFVDPPTHLGPGRDFEAVLVDQNRRLPDSVQIQYWFDGDPASAIQTRPMRFAGGRMTHRLANVHRSFRYRAVGGDDDRMPWHTLTLVEPPALEQFTVRVYPPAYAKAVAYEASGPLQALVGARVEFSGRVDRALTKITLHSNPRGVLATESSEMIGQLNSDGRSFQLPAPDGAPLTVQQSGSYWLAMTDDQGRRFVTQRWELRAALDQPPSVRLAALAESGVVTAQAVVPIEVVARDDFEVAAIELLIRLPGGGEHRVPLAGGEVPADTSGITRSDTGNELRVSTTWEVQSLNLEPGAVLEIAALARDTKPQVASSSPQRLRIIAPEELDQRLAQAQSALVARLLEALRVQREAREQAGAVRAQLEEMRQLARAQMDQLQSAELAQRRVDQILGEGSDSVLSRAAQLLAQLDINQTGGDEMRSRLTFVAQQLREIREHLLPRVQRELLSATKLAPPQLTEPQSVPAEMQERLEAAAAEQQQVIERLEALAARLGEWEDYQRLVREVEQVTEQQHRLAQATAELQPETLGRELFELPPAMRTRLRRLSREQSELTRRYENLLNRLEAKRDAALAANQSTARRLADGLQEARRENIAGAMRAGSSGLEQNQLAEALRRQHEAAEALERLADTLLQRRAMSAAQRAQQLEEAREELARLREQQAALNQQLADLRGQDAQQQLAAEQQQLADETGRLERRTARAGSQAAADLRRAAEAMKAASTAAAQAPDEAQPHARAAQQSLRDAETQLAAELGQVDRAQLRTTLDQMLGEVARMQQTQRELLQGTLALDDVQRDQGSLSASQQDALRQLAQRQRELVDQVDEPRAQLSRWPAFTMHLDGVQQDMQLAAEQLSQSDAGDVTRRWQQSAIDRLTQLQAIAAGPPPQQDASNEQGTNAVESPNDDNAQPPPATQSLEELKLIHLAQQALLERTVTLEQQRADQQSLTPAQQREAERIANEQGRLAELIAALVQQKPDEDSTKPVPAPEPEVDRDELLRDLDENLIP